jgi:predicted kinase
MSSAAPATSVHELVAALQPDACLVVLLCGMAGAGKTTFSQRLEARGFTRLSIDETMWQRFGRYGIDYSASDYRNLLDTAHAELHDRLRELMANRAAVVVDAALWNRASRQRYKAVVVQAGGRWQLIYLAVPLDVLRARLQLRNQRFDANAPFPITDDILARYAAAFEEPVDEGAIVAVP